MRGNTFVSLRVLMCGSALAWFVAASPAGRAGQIASVVDEHGHVIFVNAADATAAQSLQPGRRSRSGYLAAPSPEITTLVEKTADRHQVDPKLVHAIIQVESAYNPRAVSSKGARGLMQLIPATADRFGVQNSFNPKQNIEGGVTYLKYLLDLFGGDLPLSLAAYNAGEHAVQRSGGIPPFTETMNYVQRVTSLYDPESADMILRRKPSEPEKPPIYRLVDAQGVVHYTNGDGL